MDLGGTVEPFCQQFNLMGFYHGGGSSFHFAFAAFVRARLGFHVYDDNRTPQYRWPMVLDLDYVCHV